uniref:acylphosphatase n=1 Tax=Equus caballus TaxID=9796 RepID=A0A3Q2I8C7_HORSE
MAIFPSWGSVGVVVTHVILAAWEEDKEGLSMAEGDTLRSMDYEIWGNMPRVFLHKRTQVEGKKLGLEGWVQSADWGTGQGRLQGPLSKMHGQTPTERTSTTRKRLISAVSINYQKVLGAGYHFPHFTDKNTASQRR